MKEIGQYIRKIERGVDYASDPVTPIEGLRLIDCGLGHSPFGYPSEINELLNRVTLRDLNEYPVDPYAMNLGEKVRERFGLADKTKIFFGGAGSYGLLASVLTEFMGVDAVNNRLEVIGVGPQFTNIDMLTRRAQLHYKPVMPPLEISHEEKIEQLVEMRRRSGEAAIVYIDNPNNPTGAAVNIEMIDRLARATAKRDLLIVDEAYGDAIDDKHSAFNLVEQYPHLVVLRSVSKTVGLASPRLGYMAMSEPLAKAYSEIQLVFSVDQLTQMIASEVLNPNVLKKFLPDIRKKTAVMKEKFIQMLTDNDVQVFDTEGTVSILMARSDGGFYRELEREGITTEDGGTFKPTHKDMNDSLVRFRVPANEEDVVEVGRRIGQIRKRQ